MSVATGREYKRQTNRKSTQKDSRNEGFKEFRRADDYIEQQRAE